MRRNQGSRGSRHPRGISTTARASAAAGWLAGLTMAGCTDTELRCVGGACVKVQPLQVDNIVTAKGKVCTLDPDTSIFPYKVILVVDVSGSNDESDPPAIRGRLRATRQAIQDNLGKPGVSFAIVTFSSSPTDEIPGFSSDPQVLANKLAPVDNRGGSTNYVDTLQLVGKIISDDIAAMDPTQVPYAQYDIQWLSDGVPQDERGGGPRGFSRCSDRTTRPAVQAAENAVMALQTRLGLFKIKFSTIFLTPDGTNTPQSDGTCVPLMQPDKWSTGDVYLKEMVRNGGSYQLSSSGALKFDIKADPINHAFTQQNFFLVDMSRVVDHDQLKPDSDQDGVADEVERGALNTDPLVADSSKVGCNDRIIQLYDIDNPGRCLQICTDTDMSTPNSTEKLTDDNDTDGLFVCAEKYIRSGDRKSDTDQDEFPDPIELRFGTPLDQPFKETQDTDVDGILDADEIRRGLDPLTPQSDALLAFTYLPLTKVDSAKASVTCYEFEVQNVRLVDTEATKTTAAGDNNLCLTMVQHASDNLKAQPTISRACKVANFRMVDGGGQLSPASGTLDFAPEDFQAVMCIGASCSELAPKTPQTPVVVTP